MERIPIIALTAHSVQGYREKCLESGMDDYITKPLKKKTLLDAVNKWIDSRPTILVADDSIDNRNFINNDGYGDASNEWLFRSGGCTENRKFCKHPYNCHDRACGSGRN